MLCLIESHIEFIRDRVQHFSEGAVMNSPAVQRALIARDAQGCIRVTPVEYQPALAAGKTANQTDRSRHRWRQAVNRPTIEAALPAIAPNLRYPHARRCQHVY